jgi:hypothetical protein
MIRQNSDYRIPKPSEEAQRHFNMSAGVALRLIAMATILFWIFIGSSCNYAFSAERYILYPVIPGTSTPDRGSPNAVVIENGAAYRVISGTTTPDRGTKLYSVQRSKEPRKGKDQK